MIAVELIVLGTERLTPLIVGFRTVETNGATGPVGRAVLSPFTRRNGTVAPELGTGICSEAFWQNEKIRSQAEGNGSPYRRVPKFWSVRIGG